jgi:hypothetical protein
MHKMPYKHIAAHLKKTELACRLHYHQMSYGNNGRRRSASISSTGSFNSISATGEVSDNAFHTQLSPVVSPSSSPEPSSRRIASFDSTPTQAPRAHVPILPKPGMNYAPLTLEPSTDRIRSQDSSRLRTSSTYPYKREEQTHINFGRLLSIYETHRDSFWSKIAAEYSRDEREVSATEVEKAITRTLSQSATRSQLPPTPNLSPEASPEPQRSDSGLSAPSVVSRGFRAVNESKPDCDAENTRRSLAERCSVSALLTVEKEVRPTNQ